MNNRLNIGDDDIKKYQRKKRAGISPAQYLTGHYYDFLGIP